MRTLVLAALLSLALPSMALAADDLPRTVALGDLIDGSNASDSTPLTVPKPPPLAVVPEHTTDTTTGTLATNLDNLRVDLSQANTDGCPMQFSAGAALRSVSFRCSDGSFIGFVSKKDASGRIVATLLRCTDAHLTNCPARESAPPQDTAYAEQGPPTDAPSDVLYGTRWPGDSYVYDAFGRHGGTVTCRWRHVDGDTNPAFEQQSCDSAAAKKGYYRKTAVVD